jgi:hypothetical protein
MSIITSSPAPHAGAFAAAKARLIERITNALICPKDYSLFPKADEHVCVGEHIREAAKIFDEWLASIGSEVAENTCATIVTERDFEGVFFDAVDGNCAWLCENESAALLEERAA